MRLSLAAVRPDGGRPARGATERMPGLLPTPTDWPRVLLARPTAKDPADLDVAVRNGAFAGLRRAVHELGPEAIIREVSASGLRGRGGAGFPTGEKWRICAASGLPGQRRYVVANGYGADPASGTDRYLMERDPYAVIEGAAIAAFAVSAGEAIIAVRGEDTEIVQLLDSAIGSAEEAGFIGPDFLETGMELTISVRPVQGAYMLGEETVLLKALEGKRGQPEQRPPHPAEHGLFGQPTVVQNVQTLAAVPWIVVNGAAAFAAIGSKGSPGTVLVQARGAARDGVAEVPLGTTLREIPRSWPSPSGHP